MTTKKQPQPESVKQELDPKHLGEIIGSALASEYVPTLSRPEQASMADAFDAAMGALGSPKRAWRGTGRTLDARTLEGETLNGRTLDGKTLDGKTLDGKTQRQWLAAAFRHKLAAEMGEPSERAVHEAMAGQARDRARELGFCAEVLPGGRWTSAPRGPFAVAQLAAVRR